MQFNIALDLFFIIITNMEPPPIITDIKIQRSIFWKIYFFIYAILCLFGVMEMVGYEGFGFAEIISMFTASIGSIGLYGYVFSKRIFKRSFWLYFLAVYIIFNIAYFFITDAVIFPEMEDLSPAENKFVTLFAIIVGFVISFPAYVGLLLYGLPSNKLWKSNNN